MSIEIYGASDDLIEIEGAIREEFTYQDEDNGDLVALSDGTVLRLLYDSDGVWRITPVARGSGSLTVAQSTGEGDDYSDRASLEGDVRWAVHGIAIAKEAST